MSTSSDFKIKKGLVVAEGITLGGHSFDDIDIGSEFTDADDHIMSSGAIKEKIEDYGYTTATGDITAVVAGTGLSGGATSGSATLNVDAAQTQITSVGTIGTGTWQGTAIASAYLDSDTAHLSTTQTFTGAKSFDENATLAGFVLDGNTITGVDDSGEFTDDDAHIMTSAGINDKFGVIAGSSSITTVGTIGTGTWQGTAIASAYLDADTAHLTTVQTFTAAKTFSDGTILKEGVFSTLGTTQTLSTSHAGKYIRATAAITLTLPASPAAGEQYIVISDHAGTTTISASGSDTMNGSTSNQTITTRYEAKTFIAVDASTWIVIG